MLERLKTTPDTPSRLVFQPFQPIYIKEYR